MTSVLVTLVAGVLPAGAAPTVTAHTLGTDRYWLAAADGGVFAFGGAPYYGSMVGRHLNAPVVGLAVDGPGFLAPDVAVSRAPIEARGYWEVAGDGGVFAFGDAPFLGSMGARDLAAPVVGMAVDPGHAGYYEVAADGGVFAFGGASFYGSMGGRALAAPIVSITATPDGRGYWLVGSDGGVFAFGDAVFLGSLAGTGGDDRRSGRPGGRRLLAGQGQWARARLRDGRRRGVGVRYAGQLAGGGHHLVGVSRATGSPERTVGSSPSATPCSPVGWRARA